MFTREQYLNGEISHQDYYMQFATDAMKNNLLMAAWSGFIDILGSKDEHFNDIPLVKWDSLSMCEFRGSEMVSPPHISVECSALLKSAEETASPSTMVCIYKAIARSLVKNKTN